MNYLDKVGVTFRRFREKLDVSQEEIAARADMDRGYYSQIESGKRDIGLTTLKRIADALETEEWRIFKDVSKL